MPQASFSFEDSDAAAAALARAVPVRSGHYDELRHAGGALRPHWQRFFGELPGEDLGELDRCLAALRRQIHDDGITYNVYRDGREGGPVRPWSLDLLPFVIGAAGAGLRPPRLPAAAGRRGPRGRHAPAHRCL